jgi:hypothetical protein
LLPWFHRSIDRKLCRIDPVAAMNRRVYRLSPAGPEGLLGAMGRLAGNGGTLVGTLHEDRVQIWLAKDDGELVLTMWPGEYRARLDPLLVLDEREQAVARGGEQLAVSGGYLPDGDPRAGGYGRVFFVSRFLREA